MRKNWKKAALASLLVLFAAVQTAFAQQPRPEYPRPQFERAEWQNLNGTWTYTFDFGRSGSNKKFNESKGFADKITVPFCPESKLSGVEYKDFINTMWYHKEISVPAAWDGKKILLHFGGVDYEALIYINGKHIMTHVGGGSSFNVDITDHVKAGETANLVLRVNDDLRSGMQPGGKQCTNFYSGGCSYTRVTGIWQTVWMEAVDKSGLKSVFATPDIDQNILVVRPEFYKESSTNTLTVEVFDGEKLVSKKTVPATNQAIAVLPIKKPKLWTPETPNLYDVKYTVADKDGKVLDKVNSYAGMRKVHCANGYFYLNNKPYYQRLILDQGYYPDGVWTAPSDEALKQDILLSKECGFNGARLHQKVFEERYYYWADKLGYITWGEEGSWGLNVNSETAVRNFLSEWAEIVVRDRNHPSLVTWTPLNETWGARNGTYVRFVRDLYDMTRAMDPTRPFNDASGDTHIKTDLWTVHDYTRDPKAIIEHHTFVDGKEPYRNMGFQDWMAKYNGEPYMVDEMGGLGWIPKEERADSWGYGATIETLDEFYDILEKEIDAFAACPHVVGICYTQLTDVEQEKNGMFYYDRRPKFDLEKIRSIIMKLPTEIENPADLTQWKR